MSSCQGHTGKAANSSAALLTVCGLMPGPAWAQAPGEDPVILTKKLSVQMQPTGPVAASTGLDGSNTMPSWLRARNASGPGCVDRRATQGGGHHVQRLHRVRRGQAGTQRLPVLVP
eukprot:gene1934-2740_t